MNILLVGAGSVGMKHLQNLINLGYNNISIVSKSRSSIENFSSIPLYKTVEDATLKKILMLLLYVLLPLFMLRMHSNYYKLIYLIFTLKNQ